MKISQYHKSKGDQVEWYQSLFHKNYDKIYGSKIFDFSDETFISSDMEIGGTGSKKISKKLPKDMEKCDYDYSIYPNADMSFQIFSRGCIRKCSFCVVPEKEGYIKPVELKSLNPNGKYIYVLDNNFFASPEWESSIKTLISYKQPVQFEGIDIRILTGEMIEYLRLIKRGNSDKFNYKIAWDSASVQIGRIIKKKIPKKLRYRFTCYVLIGFDTTPEQDLFRVEKLRELKVDPFVMPFNKEDNYQKRFARWVNKKQLFKSTTWEQYYG